MSDGPKPEEEPKPTEAEEERWRKRFGWEPGDVKVTPPPPKPLKPVKP